MTISKAMLLAAFGRGRSSPLVAMNIRLAIVVTASLSVSWLLAYSLPNIGLVPLGQPVPLLLSAVFIAQLCVACSLLLASGALQHSQLAHIFQVLPLTRWQRYWANLLPSLVLAGLTVGVIAWPMGVIFHQLGVSWWAIVLAFFVGGVSGLGLVNGLPLRCKILVAGLILYVQYRCTSMLFMPGQHVIPLVVVIGFVLLGWALICLSVWIKTPMARSNFVRPVSGRSLPRALWFVKKLMRGRALRWSFVVAFILSLGIVLYARSQALLDTNLLAVSGALLAAAFVSDVRGSTKRKQPAEITTLRGTNPFTMTQYWSASLLALCAISPLVIQIGLLADLTLLAATHAGSQILLGISVGFFAGNIFVPQQRDISSQFLAATMAIGILLGLPQLPWLQSLNDTGLVLTRCVVAAGLVAFAGKIEYRRNHYDWRKYD